MDSFKESIIVPLTLGLASPSLMKKTIICKTYGKTMSFSLQIGNIQTFLFKNRRIKAVNEIYTGGLEVHRLFALSHHKSFIVQHISSRILDALRKYEKETGVEIFGQRCVRTVSPTRHGYVTLEEAV